MTTATAREYQRTSPEDQRDFDKWVNSNAKRETVRVAIGVTLGVATLAAPIVANIAGIGANNAQRVLEATVQMERLATDLEHAKKIAPETKLEIARLTHHPWYDCNQLACRAALEVRNRAARERLQAVLAGSGAPTELSAHTKQEPSVLTSHAAIRH